MSKYYIILCVLTLSSCIKNESAELQDKKIEFLEKKINDLEKKVNESDSLNKNSLLRIEKKIDLVLSKIKK